MPRIRSRRPHAPDSTDTVNEGQACLSAIERIVLDGLRRGLTIKAIAQEVGLAQGTVELHIKHSLRKLRVRSREELLSQIVWRH
jgi:DNA-binding NarL/FixJ family response regulator